ncbi:hypothetical protein [Streptomyces adelaidensis]|uniref:hypothetical protein n=1 Tax=Streptomyces adelaidensis TaxID=2796465 RepID=UPI00190398FF|nr:hypothetical protein [Streptomyces adelaidensis]
MTDFARDTGTAAPTEPDALIQTLYEDLSRLPASAQLDAMLCLLEAARLMLPTLAPARGELAHEDLDDIRAAMRAASLSVRSYLWRTGGHVPVDRK